MSGPIEHPTWPEQREKPQVHVRFHTQQAELMLQTGEFDSAGVHAKMALMWATLYAAAKGYAG